MFNLGLDMKFKNNNVVERNRFQNTMPAQHLVSCQGVTYCLDELKSAAEVDPIRIVGWDNLYIRMAGHRKTYGAFGAAWQPFLESSAKWKVCWLQKGGDQIFKF